MSYNTATGHTYPGDYHNINQYEMKNDSLYEPSISQDSNRNQHENLQVGLGNLDYGQNPQMNEYITADNMGVPYGGNDPGVIAVSHALFGGNEYFQSIPIAQHSPVFRRRRYADHSSEWSNAFVTRVDPCDCTDPETAYAPYQVSQTRREDGGIGTKLDFN